MVLVEGFKLIVGRYRRDDLLSEGSR